MNFENKNKKGFTLIEMLIVVAIISLLASSVYIYMNNAQSKSLDAKRKSDVNQIARALYMNGAGKTTFSITDDVNGTWGYINTVYAPATMSINSALVSKGYFSSPVNDPKNTSVASNYMFGSCSGGKRAVYATLDNPNAETDQTIIRALAAPYNCSKFVDPRLGGNAGYAANYAIIVE